MDIRYANHFLIFPITPENDKQHYYRSMNSPVIPSNYYSTPSKELLLKEFVGKKISDLPTPSILIDRCKFVRNSQAMLVSASKLGAQFRCHIKTHKTLEGVDIQLGYFKDKESPKTDRIAVSTLAEAWTVVPLARSGKITNILFGLPIAKSKVGELYELSKHVKNLEVMVDSKCQIQTLYEFAKQRHVMWHVFVKIDMGYSRAGICENSPRYTELLEKLLEPETRKYVCLYGLYCHAGQSYDAKGTDEAERLLVEEIKHANNAAKQALALDASLKLTLSVGATPTAHVSQTLNSMIDLETAIGEKLSAELELHAGNYPCCDLQQVATGLISEDQVSLFLLAEVLSKYEGRNGKCPGEQLINAGAIALSRETGPFPGHGKVVGPKKYGPWIVGKVSQEHGVLYPQKGCEFIPYGEKITILPQHACITACAHAWYFVLENGLVVDVWVPAKTW